MLISKKLLRYLNPIYFVFALEFIRIKKSWWWLVLVIGLLLLIFTVWDYSKKKFDKRFLNFLITPFFLWLCSFTLLLFTEQRFLYHGIVAAIALLLFLFLEQVLNYFYFPIKYQPYTLENFSFYLNLLSALALSVSLFGSLIFLRLNIFIAAAICYLVVFALVKQVFWANKIDWSKYLIFCFVIPLIISELFIALSYLPISFYVNGLIIALSFYLMVGLSRLFLVGNLNKKNTINYIIITALAIIILLATAQWV